MTTSDGVQKENAIVLQASSANLEKLAVIAVERESFVNLTLGFGDA